MRIIEFFVFCFQQVMLVQINLDSIKSTYFSDNPTPKYCHFSQSLEVSNDFRKLNDQAFRRSSMNFSRQRRFGSKCLRIRAKLPSEKISLCEYLADITMEVKDHQGIKQKLNMENSS